MIFASLDFHPETGQHVPNERERAYRLRTNYVVDSFNLRIPKKIRTDLFHKLNVVANGFPPKPKGFWVVEGIACVELFVPDIASIYRATQAEAVKTVRRLLGIGVRVAARHDPLFGHHIDLWKRLLATTSEEFDYNCCISRFHPSRRWKCEAVLRITPVEYHYDVVVIERRTLQEIERHRIKSTECALPYYTGIGFRKLQWEGPYIVGITKDGTEAFRFETDLPSSTSNYRSSSVKRPTGERKRRKT